MQSLKALLHKLIHGGEEERARQFAIGAIVYLVLAVIGVVAGITYLSPPGHRNIFFRITDASAIKTGMEVRVAGLTVGKVDQMSLATDSIRIGVSIPADIHLADQTSVEIRMLTAAGGYYVALVSAGDKPLDGAEIPAARSAPPYKLPDLLASSADKLREFDPVPLGTSLDRLASGLEDNPGAVSTVIAGVRTITQIVNQQQEQLRSVLDTAEELMRAAAKYQPLLHRLLQKLSTLMVVVDNAKVGFNIGLTGLIKVLNRILPVIKFYDDHRDWLLDALKRTNNALKTINSDIPRILWNMGNLVNNLRNALLPPGSSAVPAPENQLVATDMCVPIAGRTC